MSQLVKGSLSDVARTSNISLAQAFLSAKAIVVIDTSYSMADNDCPGKRRRHDVACEQLFQLQRDLAGQVAVVSFSDHARFCPGGIPSQPNGGTDLAKALKFIYPADGTGVRIVVISDGEPNDSQEALAEASKFISKIDCIYIGPETSLGRDFLRRLAEASGGTFADQSVKDLPQLAATVQQLLVA